MTERRVALVVGSTGIVGGNICERLLADGWTVHGLARRPERSPKGTIPLAADLNDRQAVAKAISRAGPVTHLFQASWTPANTEEEACEINARHLSNVLDGLQASGQPLKHVVLITGVKHYLGPFKDFGRYLPDTPFLEETPRLPIPNFYYDQEDVLFAAAQRNGFTWSVHRPNAIVGFAVGALMNHGLTLACYASICRETGRPFAFTGVQEQWDMLTEISDARLIARQAAWAATTPQAANRPYNTGNGDVFRYKRMWKTIADHFGLEAPPYDGRQQSLQELMADAGPIWRSMAEKYGLAEPDISRLATWWHTDADFGRKVECISDMTRSRKAGFLDYQSSTDTFLDLFRRLEDERIIPRFER
ncbi:SDR family oxidoreductase [Mesorhizobium sp. VNQ89]|uniref:SDR family oxidoreductase n=1 Tax=Mesorhizobium quangtriensis TaxID=3157709 RepID=UPI0032B82D99